MNTRIIYQIIEYDPLLDSSNMSIKEWKKIATDIEKCYCYFDGFVVLHGTDTMAFTSSILSFMIEGLNKPIIITGAQRPIFEDGTDGISNFYYSLIFAAAYNISDVCVFFDKVLLKGNRCKKIDCSGFDAFDSPNYPHLAEITFNNNNNNVTINCNYPLLNRRKISKLSFKYDLVADVGILYCYPTIRASDVHAFLENLHGAVILTFGAGNAPLNDHNMVNTLKQEIDTGLVIINVSQCLKGTVTSNYEVGCVLNEIGIISGNDITVEAAYAKLVVLLNYLNKAELEADVNGEMTVN